MDFPRIDGQVIALDYETTGVKWWLCDAFSVAISVGDKDYYYDFRDTPGAVLWLTDNLPKAATVYCHNAKFEMHFTRKLTGLLPEQVNFRCTMVRACLIDEHLPMYNLDFVGKKYVGVGKDGDLLDELRAVFGQRLAKDKLMGRLADAPRHVVGKYAKQDARTTLKLGLWQEDEIVRQSLQKVDELERQLTPVLVRMEHHGIPVDIYRAEEATRDLTVVINREQRDLNKMAGFEVNPNPSNSIKRLFNPRKNENDEWILVDGTKCEQTDAGAPSIDADCLRRMKHPAASKILRVRKLLKARDTFLNGHILGHHHNGIVHPNINQTKGDNDAGTGTGRLSINSPALQQIPSRDKEVKAIVRPCFIPNTGQKWLGIDWSSHEYRVFAHYLNDADINKRYADDPDTDFHQVVSDMTGIPRNAQYVGGPSSKAINLSMVFGAGPGKAAEMMGLPFTIEKLPNGREYRKPGPEAQELFDKYHKAVPGVKALLENAAAVARSRGYVVTAMGRHIRFPGGQFTHKAGGLIFQGTSADNMKTKMIEVDALCREHGNSTLLLTVHDEIGVSVPDADDPIVQKIVKAYTTFDGVNSAVKLRIPITCDYGVGDNWFDAKG